MQQPNFDFNITHRSKKTKARLGRLRTPHGEIETPSFIFCATKGAVKGAHIKDVKESGTQIILSNTYHMMLQPGPDLVEKMGGLHKFMGWDGPMLTDSGGYQIFSLGHGSVASEIKGNRKSSYKPTLLKINEEGAKFKSYIDGKIHFLTPERSMEIQRKLGADLIVVLDECTPFHVEKEYTAKSMEMSHRWALRSLKEFERHDDGKQALYGIIQGGVYPDLRKVSTDFVNDNPFFGHAVGGSLGASKDQMYDVVGTTMAMLDPKRPVHLLGIGGIKDIFSGVTQGIDTFDCVHPTRIARHGGALVRPGQGDTNGREHLNLRNVRFKEDDSPIDESCPCQACTTISKAYLHHLLKAKEMIALQLLTLHNITFMNRLLSAIRDGIRNDDLESVKKKWCF
ncbi:MAG: tRNA guanosine(34) transglycosylase Tgt [Alphaproteobacteria bacterium]|jgi:queuine tRNA-ribosyltransferase|nr:tRNA guanosine(34) transglycosylase Tgt [Alphaproteobacteria bacterium]MBT5390604.1 tRNA guanosine(34) transglycosylase Tgt [Alphaproteobacteria bacterium]MBT5654258.1 tRNA guanosine(34) transglycosylase Tgt [Alphaproteobacteria bacterium]